MFTKEQIEEIRTRLALTGYKDTQFEAASLPLSGEEIIAIVQNGRNKKVRASVFIPKETEGEENNNGNSNGNGNGNDSGGGTETNGLKHIVLSQAEYDALPIKDITTIYLIVNIPDNWVFGGTFPITLMKAWSFGNKFPILLK